MQGAGLASILSDNSQLRPRFTLNVVFGLRGTESAGSNLLNNAGKEVLFAANGHLTKRLTVRTARIARDVHEVCPGLREDCALRVVVATIPALKRYHRQAAFCGGGGGHEQERLGKGDFAYEHGDLIHGFLL